MVVSKDGEQVYEVVLVVESTANLVPYFEILMKSYVIPTLEWVCFIMLYIFWKKGQPFFVLICSKACVCVRACKHTGWQACRYTQSHILSHTHTHTHTHTCTHTHTHTHTYMYVILYIYIYMNTHTQPCAHACLCTEKEHITFHKSRYISWNMGSTGAFGEVNWNKNVLKLTARLLLDQLRLLENKSTLLSLESQKPPGLRG